MPRLKVSPKNKRKTVTFTLEQGDIDALDLYVDYAAQSMPFAKVSRQTILEHVVKDFISTQVIKAARK
jgi:hypothetical protein